MTNWGIPDWRDPSAYGDTKRWSENRWRWEFIRRRDECRNDFSAHKDETFRLFEKVNARSGGTTLRPDEPGFVAHFTGCYEKYGLWTLPNRAIGAQPFWVIPFLRRGPSILQHPEDNLANFQATDGVVIFDLTAPINPQLVGLKRALEAQQQYKLGKKVRSGPRHPDKWFMYLRVLDAKESNVSWAKIEKSGVLGTSYRKHPLAARDVWKQADALRSAWPS